MGILDSLKGMVGKGSPKVEVKLLKSQATVQESVKGIATFTGGEYPVAIDAVVLYMLMVEDLKEIIQILKKYIKRINLIIL